MPLARKNLSKGRVDFASSLTRTEINSLVGDPQLKILQTCDAVESATWEMMNDLLFAMRPDVELRVYGFYSSECDLSFLTYARLGFPDLNWPPGPTRIYGDRDLVIETNGETWIWVSGRSPATFRYAVDLIANSGVTWEQITVR